MTTTPIDHMPADLGAQATTHAAEARTPRPITVPNQVPSRRPAHAAAARVCPSCGAVLDGGPVKFRCEPCGRPVMAADLDTEYRPNVPRIDSGGRRQG